MKSISIVRRSLADNRGMTFLEVLISTLVVAILSVAALTAVSLMRTQVVQLEHATVTDAIVASMQAEAQAAGRYFAASSSQTTDRIGADLEIEVMMPNDPNTWPMAFNKDEFCPQATAAACPELGAMKGRAAMYIMQSPIPGIEIAEMRYFDPDAQKGERRLKWLMSY